MPAVLYPVDLPSPMVGWSGLVRERVGRSSIAGDPKARRRWSDKMADANATWTYTAAQMAVWWPWYHDTLLDGQLWFTAKGPGAGGLIDRVMRYRPATVTVVPFGHGIARISAELEVRGRSAAPTT
jgi:hypothetical protein